MLIIGKKYLEIKKRIKNDYNTRLNRLQLDRIDPKGFWYSFNNMIVAILVTVSLLYTMNKASMVIEVFWFIISIYGIVMYFKRQNENTNN